MHLVLTVVVQYSLLSRTLHHCRSPAPGLKLLSYENSLMLMILAWALANAFVLQHITLLLPASIVIKQRGSLVFTFKNLEPKYLSGLPFSAGAPSTERAAIRQIFTCLRLRQQAPLVRTPWLHQAMHSSLSAARATA